PFAKIVPVVFRVDIVAVVAVGRVLVGIALPVVGTPTIFTVGRPGAEAFLVTVVHRLPKQVCAVLIRLIVSAAAIVAINRRGIEIGIVVKVVTLFPKSPVLVPQTLQILLLETVLRHAPLLLQGRRLLFHAALLLIEATRS